MTNVLSALDATFLELEEQNDSALMSIGGVMVFDSLPGGGRPRYDDVCDAIAARLIRLPRYTQRLSSPRMSRLSWPRWIDDDQFDVRGHVKHVALPAPGGQAELCAWAADFYSHRLDRTRPLWEMALIEGLPDGRWALAHKTHHCLVDGVGSVDVAYLILDLEATPTEVAPPVRPSASSAGHEGRALPFIPEPIVQSAAAGVQAVRAGLGAARHPREALKHSLSLAELLVRDELIAAPHSSINGEIGSSRRFGVVTVPLADLKAIQAELGGSLNDVVLAACTSGLRTLLRERGERPPAGLRAMVPQNIRAASEHLALGNRISSLFVELPVDEPMAHARHRKIVASTRRLKRSGAGAGASTLLDLAALAPPVLHAVVARTLFANRLFNVTITNVPGPQIPLYALGAQLREVYPVVPLAADHAVGIAIFSYDGLVTFGVLTDADSTGDIATLIEGIEQGIEDLRGLARPPARRQRRREARI
ncbi:MAG TPA: wax ester/triacylglycerol synthase family O-acyltransferase [Solirubrobacteraceae bacterium]|nr:wax ester/triacylglycerol synthase family O-acyltransferase [Solirubrobacteraceae bacterium]